MLNLNATQERLLRSFESAVVSEALFKLMPILLATMLAGCAARGERASALDHSSSGRAADAAGRGYNASAAHAGDSGGLTADPSGASPIQGGATGKRKTRRAGAGGAADGTGATAGGPDDTGMVEGDAVDDDQDSSLTDGAPGAGKPGGPGSGKRRARGAGHAIAGAGAASSDEADSATDRSAAGAVASSPGKSKGARGATTRRRGGGGAQGSNDESADMGEAGDEGSDTQIAAVEVPSGKVEVNEEYQPLTLGGVLPVVLGVNEEGRFDFDQYALRDEVRAILDALAETLKTAEYDRLDIFGYTDRIGAVDYNQRLSELRAYAVAQYLMHRGVPENKIRYEGRGDKDPLSQADECQGLAREDLITCLQKDRRVEIEASIHRKHATVVQ